MKYILRKFDKILYNQKYRDFSHWCEEYIYDLKTEKEYYKETKDETFMYKEDPKFVKAIFSVYHSLSKLEKCLLRKKGIFR